MAEKLSHEVAPELNPTTQQDLALGWLEMAGPMGHEERQALLAELKIVAQATLRLSYAGDTKVLQGIAGKLRETKGLEGFAAYLERAVIMPIHEAEAKLAEAKGKNKLE